ncbi:MAG: DUF4397 domain-containing protein [Nocardioides sp.]
MSRTRVPSSTSRGARLVGAGGLVLAAVASIPTSAHSAPLPGRIVIVQAVPKDALDVTVDGRSVHQDADVGTVVGPVTVTPGTHVVAFTNASGSLRLRSTVDVSPGSSKDIVVHLPAQSGGAPVVNSYKTPRRPIAPGKARVLIAHTATVAPADVRVDGTVVFHDIANGEYATADVAAGEHSVALLPAGLSRNPILGPLHVDLEAGTVTMVYAVGTPSDGSMRVITHAAVLGSNGAVVPESIDTGAAGLAAHLPVHPFSSAAGTSLDREGGPTGSPLLGVRPATWWIALVGLAFAAFAVARRRARRTG